MTSTWKRRTISFLVLCLLAMSLPTIIRIGARLFCYEPDQNLSVADHLRKNVNNVETDKLIIFIHGVNSNSHAAWLNTTTKSSWPSMVLQDRSFSQQGKVYDVFLVDYQSPYICNAPDIRQIADTLRATLSLQLFDRYKQIFIVAHSMGGLVAEQLLVGLPAPSLSRFKAVFFFGSPTEGSELAGFAALYSGNRQYPEMASLGSPFLRDLGMNWKRLRTDQASAGLAPKAYCGYEEYETSGVHVVPENYEDAYRCDEESLPITSNHSDLVKPANSGVLVYQYTRDRILTLSQPFVVEAHAVPQKRTAHLEDCWLNGEHCGFRFSTGTVVPLNFELFTGDVVLMNQTDQTKTPTTNAAMLFATNDTPPYGGGRDTGARAGIVEVQAHDLDEVKEAPPSGYTFHWFPVKVGGVYCIRTRDGLHYAKIQIRDLTSKTIDFDWVYQPTETRNFNAN